MSSTTAFSPSDLATAEAVVRAALAGVMEEMSREDLAIQPGDDLFAQLDSFAVVELLLRTETELEAATGRYVPLADETLLDADRSPLRRVEQWIGHVAAAIARG